MLEAVATLSVVAKSGTTPDLLVTLRAAWPLLSASEGLPGEKHSCAEFRSSQRQALRGRD